MGFPRWGQWLTKETFASKLALSWHVIISMLCNKTALIWFRILVFNFPANRTSILYKSSSLKYSGITTKTRQSHWLIKALLLAPPCFLLSSQVSSERSLSSSGQWLTFSEGQLDSKLSWCYHNSVDGIEMSFLLRTLASLLCLFWFLPLIYTLGVWSSQFNHMDYSKSSLLLPSSSLVGFTSISLPLWSHLRWLTKLRKNFLFCFVGFLR